MRKFSLQNFDSRCRDALQRAQERAAALRHRHVGLVHFLLVALSVDEAKRVVLDHEVDVPQVRRALTARLSERPKDLQDRVLVGSDLLRVLQTASANTPAHLSVNLTDVMTAAMLDYEARSLLRVSGSTPTASGPAKFSLTAFDEATRKTLRNAQNMASEHAHSHIDIPHFLVQALQDEKIQAELDARGMNANAVRRACVDEFESIPRDPGERVYVGKPLLDLLVGLQEESAPEIVPLLEVVRRALRERQHLLPASSRGADAFLAELTSNHAIARWFAELVAELDDEGFWLDEGATDALIEWLHERDAERVRLNLGTPLPDEFVDRYTEVYGRSPAGDLLTIYTACDGLQVEVEIDGKVVPSCTLIPSQAALWGHEQSGGRVVGWVEELIELRGSAYFPLSFSDSPTAGGHGIVVDHSGNVLRIDDHEAEVVPLTLSISEWLTELREQDLIVEDVWGLS